MATFLDIGLLSHVKVIFPLLLVFVIVFAVLTKSEILGDNKGLASLASLAVAMMMLFVPGVVDVFSIMAPWFVVIMLLIFMFTVVLLFLGTSPGEIAEYANSWGIVHWFLLIIALIIFIGSIGSVYGESMLPYSGGAVADGGNATAGTDTGDFNSNVGRVIFHPKTLGMIIILVTAALAIRLLSGAQG
ncbi:hypothetical protein ACFL0V_02105 [Nanoarchaeota archaeon]